MGENKNLYSTDSEEDILSEIDMEYSESNEISEGTCSCVCINDEQCCGCLIQ